MSRMLHFSEEEFIEVFRAHCGLVSASAGITVSGASEEHIDSLVLRCIRAWYAGLLKDAPPALLPVRDLKESVSASLSSAGDSLRIILPPDGYRLVEVKLIDWDRPLSRFNSPGTALALRQQDTLLRATCTCPCAICDGRTLTLYGLKPLTAHRSEKAAVAPDANARIESLLMTAWPADGSYEFAAELFPDEDILKRCLKI